ncbi:hypothetical protein HYALB_00005121 [Hymenoscyphus albidus]|uniref:Uncharacterized protein n=1 Tax=Hymenoscyphus albidus TaxID=595503 RepID=A0A9N9M1F1_9HELO|nr:hypothetical protein HYALB_00005121 [Hymenoscyphus albidus]
MSAKRKACGANATSPADKKPKRMTIIKISDFESNDNHNARVDEDEKEKVKMQESLVNKDERIAALEESVRQHEATISEREREKVKMLEDRATDLAKKREELVRKDANIAALEDNARHSDLTVARLMGAVCAGNRDITDRNKNKAIEKVLFMAYKSHLDHLKEDSKFTRDTKENAIKKLFDEVARDIVKYANTLW